MGERIHEMNPADIEERLHEMNLDDTEERLSDMNPDDMGDRLHEMNPGMGERVTEMNSDDTEDRSLDMNPDDVGEVNPDQSMLNYDRLDENVPIAHQSGHTLSRQEVIEDIIDAALSGEYGCVIDLIDHCVDLPVQYKDSQGNNLLHAILRSYYFPYHQEERDNILTCVIKLVEAGVDINHMNTDRETPIMIAANKGLYSIVIYLIDHCADIQYTDENQNNVLNLVLNSVRRYGENDELLQCVIILVEAGVDVNHLNTDRETPIMIATRNGLYNIVIYLIDHCVDIQYTDRNQNNDLYLVLYRGRYCDEIERDELLQRVMKLVASGVDANHINTDRETPIMLAARYRLYNIVIYLIDHCATIEYTDENQNNVLHLVLNSGSGYGESDELLQCAIRLVEVGVDVNHLNTDRETPIMIAARYQLYNIVIYLIDHCATIQYTDEDQNNVLHLVLNRVSRCRESNELLQCVIRLVEAGVDVNHMNTDIETPIMIAANKGLYSIVVYLIDHCVDIQYTDKDQNNVLHLVLACDWKYGESSELLQCVMKLVEAGVDINQMNTDGETPIMIAANKGFYNSVIYLIDHCVDIQYTNKNQNNVLHLVLACDWEYGESNELLQCVIKLVEAGVDVNHMNTDRETPIMLAAKNRLNNIVIYLIDHCATIQYNDEDQNNALHLVLNRVSRYRESNELLQCVIRLVEAGVDVNHLNTDIETPIMIAARNGFYNIVIYLIDHCFDIQYTDENQNNVLHLVLNSVSRYGESDELLQCAIRLVEAGVDGNHLNTDRETPIMIAARYQLYNIVIYLIDHCVDIQYTDGNRNNVLNLVLNSVRRYDESDELLQCVIRLVEAGVDVNSMNKYRKTPIYTAADRGLHKVLIYLFVHCAHVDYVAINDQCVLHRVLDSIRFMNEEDVNQYSDDCIQVVKTLITMGVDVNKPDIDGNTPLFHIAKYSIVTELSRLKFNNKFRLHCDLITALIDAGCNVDHQNNKGQTPLMYYTRKEVDIRILKLMIDLSGVNLTDNNGDTACSYFVEYYLLNSADILKPYPVGVLMSPINGVKLFHQILTCKRLELFNYYMRLQLIVNGVTTEGEHMLHLLARVKYNYSQGRFHWLFNKKLDINHRCSKNNTPIMIAALLLNSKYLQLFTRHPRIDINAQNNQGHTALHLCIIGFTMVKDGLNKRQGSDVYCEQKYLIYIECVGILLAAVGIDVNIQDGRGRTALMMAAMKNDRFLIRKLLNAGALVNSGDESALHHLDVFESVFDITFKLLVSAGDNMLLNLPCINGNTLIQETLRFPRCWDPHTAVSFIKYLVGENVCLQSLVTSSVESSYNQIDMRELSSQERDKLRKLLYLSGAPENQIVATLNFEKEDTNVERDEVRTLLLITGAHEEKIIQDGDRDDQEVGFHSRHQEIFTNYCCNISLLSQCRRTIRQELGLGIKAKVVDLPLPRIVNDFLLLTDVLRPKDFNIDNIDDGCNDYDDDDGYDGYDIVKDRDADYSQYDYQYFTLNTDDDLRGEFFKIHTLAKFPSLFSDDDDDDDDDDGDGDDDDDF